VGLHIPAHLAHDHAQSRGNTVARFAKLQGINREILERLANEDITTITQIAEDFIACSRELEKRGYSTSARTAGISQSMGGVLAGGAYTTSDSPC